MATPTYPPSTTYDLTVGIPVNMDEAVYMISPDDSPLITGLNSDGLQILPTMSVDEKQFKWLDEEILLPRSTLAVNVVTAATEIVVAAGDQSKFSTGDLVTIETAGGSGTAAKHETILITGYSVTTADTLLVTKGIVGTSTTYATSAVVVGIGSYLAEGSDPENARVKDRTERSNYTQIFGPTRMTMSRSEMGRRKFGVANEFTHQLNNRITEMTIQRDQAMIWGRQKEDTSAEKRSTGGMWEFITSNHNSTLTQLNVTNLSTMMQSCYDAGGVPDLVSANPKALTDLNDITNTSIVRVTFDEARRGRVPVRFVDTEFGIVTVVRNRWMPTYAAVGWSREQATRRVFDPLIMKRLAVTGDAENAMIVCEEGLEFKGQSHAFKMDALSY